ncbi:MAG: NADH-quinone oxidoreductase subunit C [Chthoniobacteraceae bacterium]|jgi:NADH-quinone oxidoreductase subunit C
MPLSDSVATLEGKFAILGKKEFRGETALTVDRGEIVEICRFCKESLGFDYLLDITSIDNFGDEPRFEVVYELSSIATNEHLRLRLTVSEDEPLVDTVSGIWPTANWHEREIYDMMGISFTGHPDLRRILMWEGYPYYPLRKDFPLGGKASEVPEVAFTKPAPLEGGPFVTVPTTATTKDREPRARRIDE